MAIYVVKPSMPSFDEYIEAIRPIFESCILSNMGPIHQEFQQKLMDFLHVPHLSLFVNGHLALENAIQALGLSDSLGGEVITTPFTLSGMVSNQYFAIFENLTIP